MNKNKQPKEAENNGLYTLLANENFTEFYDDNKQPILLGDKLKSEWGVWSDCCKG